MSSLRLALKQSLQETGHLAVKKRGGSGRKRSSLTTTSSNGKNGDRSSNAVSSDSKSPTQKRRRRMRKRGRGKQNRRRKQRELEEAERARRAAEEVNGLNDDHTRDDDHEHRDPFGDDSDDEEHEFDSEAGDEDSDDEEHEYGHDHDDDDDDEDDHDDAEDDDDGEDGDEDDDDDDDNEEMEFDFDDEDGDEDDDDDEGDEDDEEMEFEDEVSPRRSPNRMRRKRRKRLRSRSRSMSQSHEQDGRRSPSRKSSASDQQASKSTPSSHDYDNQRDDIDGNSAKVKGKGRSRDEDGGGGGESHQVRVSQLKEKKRLRKLQKMKRLQQESASKIQNQWKKAKEDKHQRRRDRHDEHTDASTGDAPTFSGSHDVDMRQSPPPRKNAASSPTAAAAESAALPPRVSKPLNPSASTSSASANINGKDIGGGGSSSDKDHSKHGHSRHTDGDAATNAGRMGKFSHADDADTGKNNSSEANVGSGTGKTTPKRPQHESLGVASSATDAATAASGGLSTPTSVPANPTKKKKKNKNQQHQDGGGGGSSSGKSNTVPPPARDLLEWTRNLSERRCRKHMAPGLRVKVRFATKVKREGKVFTKRRWYGGRISAVSKEGSKIRIKYDDGTSEVSKFPDKDIVVDDTSNGTHAVSADKFVPPQMTPQSPEATVATMNDGAIAAAMSEQPDTKDQEKNQSLSNAEREQPKKASHNNLQQQQQQQYDDDQQQKQQQKQERNAKKSKGKQQATPSRSGDDRESNTKSADASSAQSQSNKSARVSAPTADTSPSQHQKLKTETGDKAVATAVASSSAEPKTPKTAKPHKDQANTKAQLVTVVQDTDMAKQANSHGKQKSALQIQKQQGATLSTAQHSSKVEGNTATKVRSDPTNERAESGDQESSMMNVTPNGQTQPAVKAGTKGAHAPQVAPVAMDVENLPTPSQSQSKLNAPRTEKTNDAAEAQRVTAVPSKSLGTHNTTSTPKTGTDTSTNTNAPGKTATSPPQQQQQTKTKEKAKATPVDGTTLTYQPNSRPLVEKLADTNQQLGNQQGRTPSSVPAPAPVPGVGTQKPPMKGTEAIINTKQEDLKEAPKAKVDPNTARVKGGGSPSEPDGGAKKQQLNDASKVGGAGKDTGSPRKLSLTIRMPNIKHVQALAEAAKHNADQDLADDEVDEDGGDGVEDGEVKDDASGLTGGDSATTDAEEAAMQQGRTKLKSLSITLSTNPKSKKRQASDMHEGEALPQSKKRILIKNISSPLVKAQDKRNSLSVLPSSLSLSLATSASDDQEPAHGTESQSSSLLSAEAAAAEKSSRAVDSSIQSSDTDKAKGVDDGSGLQTKGKTKSKFASPSGLGSQQRDNAQSGHAVPKKRSSKGSLSGFEEVALSSLSSISSNTMPAKKRRSPYQRTDSPTPLSNKPSASASKVSSSKAQRSSVVSKGTAEGDGAKSLVDGVSMKKSKETLQQSATSAFDNRRPRKGANDADASEGRSAPGTMELATPAPIAKLKKKASSDSLASSQRSGRRAAQEAKERMIGKETKGGNAAGAATTSTGTNSSAKDGSQTDLLKKKKKRKKEGDGNDSDLSENDPQWVQCDGCGKWRVLPPSVDASSLPNHWYCDMNRYDPKRSNCAAPEQTPKQVAKERKKAKKRRKRMEQAAVMDALNEHSSPSLDAGSGKVPDKQPSSSVEADVTTSSNNTNNNSSTKKDGRDQQPRVSLESKPKQRRASPATAASSAFAANEASDSVVTAVPSAPAPTSTQEKERKKKKAKQQQQQQQQEIEETCSAVVEAEARPKGKPAKKRGRPARQESAKDPADTEKETPPSRQEDMDNVAWVQCEKCNKWRKLPPEIQADDLPDTWYCTMNTWNPPSASCDAPEDKADALHQDINTGQVAAPAPSKFSYRSLIFGNGKRHNRPTSERTRAAESIFAPPIQDVENQPHPVVMYAKSTAFLPRTSNFTKKETTEGKTPAVFDVMAKNRLWETCCNSGYSTSREACLLKKVKYFDDLGIDDKQLLKLIVTRAIGVSTMTCNEVLAECKFRQWDGIPSTWVKLRSECNEDQIVNTLLGLVREGILEMTCNRDMFTDISKWVPQYRLCRRRRYEAIRDSRCMKISKPWKQRESDESQWVSGGAVHE